MPIRRRASAVVLSFLLADAAWAQFDQYRAPGSPTERPGDAKKALEEAIGRAPWHLGPVRVEPWAGLRDVEYVSDALGSAGDLTASVGAGLRGFLHTGSQVIWAAHALPEYVWWQDSADRRRLDGRYGLGLFGFWNRLGVEATATRRDEQGFLTPELLQPAHQRIDQARLSLQLAVTGRISVFAGGDRIAVRDLEDAPEPALARLDSLDRDETLARAGLSYRLPHGWSIGLGAERSQTDFVEPPAGFDRSSSGTSPLLLVRQQNDDRFFSLEVVRRSLDPEPGSSFAPYDATTAELGAGFNSSGRLRYWLYGRRSLVYSLDQDYSYLQDDRIGGSADLAIGWRTQIGGFVEVGRNDYTPARPGTPDRREDTRSFGASLAFRLRRSAALSLRVARSEYDSSLAVAADRSVTRFGGGLTLGVGRSPWY